MAKPNFLEINNGEIINKVNYELERVMANINDINTDPQKPREINIKITLRGNESRSQIMAVAQVTSKIQNTKKIEATLFNVNGTTKDGEKVSYLQEATPVVAGQMNIFGEIQPEGKKYMLGNVKGEEDKDCKECEHKDECSLENVKKEALEFLDAVFNLTLIQLKKEYQEEFKKKYEEFRKKEWAYLVAIPMQKYSTTLCKGFETMMNDEKGMQTLEILGSALDKMNVLNK